MQKIPQEQGSPLWLEWRKDKIGASEAGTLMGISHFQTIGELWEYKLGLRAPQEENEHMKRGKVLEHEAKECFEEYIDDIFYPQVMVHPDYPWMIASLDGLNMAGTHALEIKCPGKKDHEIAMVKGMIPPKYYAQLQHIMAVSGLNEIYYFSYKDGDGRMITQPRDENYIKQLIEKEYAFYVHLMKGKQILEDHYCLMDLMKEKVYKLLCTN